ncbi:hypothetical protein [Arthrobacter sp. D1-17]
MRAEILFTDPVAAVVRGRKVQKALGRLAAPHREPGGVLPGAGSPKSW